MDTRALECISGFTFVIPPFRMSVFNLGWDLCPCLVDFGGPSQCLNFGPTIVDKSLGTNLHLWRFFTRAEQSLASERGRISDLSLGNTSAFAGLTVTRKFIYTCSAPAPPPPPHNVGHVYTLFLQSFNIVWGGGGGGSNAF